MDLLIFDLDGTLVDSRRDIATSVNELLSRLGRPELPSGQVFGFIGNGVRKLIERSLREATAPEELDEAVQLYLQIYGRVFSTHRAPTRVCTRPWSSWKR